MLDSDICQFVGLGIVLTVLVAITLIGLSCSLRDQKNDVKNGKYMYNAYIVEDDHVRYGSVRATGDGRIAVTPDVGEAFTIVLVGDNLDK